MLWQNFPPEEFARERSNDRGRPKDTRFTLAGLRYPDRRSVLFIVSNIGNLKEIIRIHLVTFDRESRLKTYFP